MSNRPIVRLPLLASTESYAAGGENWSATATKIDPGTGFEAAGISPKTRAPGQYENFFLNALGQWGLYLRDLPIRNWFNMREDLWAAEGIVAIEYVPGADIWWLAQKSVGDDLYFWSTYGNPYNEWDFTSVSASGGKTGEPRFLVTDDDGTMLFFVAASGVTLEPDVWKWLNGGSFSRVHTGGFSNFSIGTSFFLDSKFCIAGYNSDDGALECHYSSDDGANWLTTSNIEASTASHVVRAVSNNDRDFAIVLASDGAETIVATSSSGSSWSLKSDITIATFKVVDVKAFACSDDRIFMAAGNFVTAGAFLQAYTTTDGITWTDRGIIVASATAICHGLSVSGNTWIAMVETATGVFHWYVSHNNGDNWARVNYFFRDSETWEVLDDVSPIVHRAGQFVSFITQNTSGEGVLLKTLSV